MIVIFMLLFAVLLHVTLSYTVDINCADVKCSTDKVCIYVNAGCSSPPCTTPVCVHMDDESSYCGNMTCVNNGFCHMIYKDFTNGWIPTCVSNSLQRDEDQKKCAKNEVWNPCSACEQTCYDSKMDCSYVKCSKPNCVCGPGFVRYNGECVTLQQCNYVTGSGSCPKSEIFSCQPLCDETCGGKQKCVARYGAACFFGCTCRPFYKRNYVGECVHKNLCYKYTRCPENEHWDECFNCEDKCEGFNRLVTPKQNCRNDCRSGCACNKGYYRENGKCTLHLSTTICSLFYK